MKDAEIQRLQADIQAKEVSNQTQIIENLHTELTAMVESNKHGKGDNPVGADNSYGMGR